MQIRVRTMDRSGSTIALMEQEAAQAHADKLRSEGYLVVQVTEGGLRRVLQTGELVQPPAVELFPAIRGG